MKSKIITGFICLTIGIALGAGGLFLYNKKQTEKLKNGITVETIEGDHGGIEHGKIKNYHDRIEFNTIAKKPGVIKTTIKKDSFCPKTYKNSLSLIVYGPDMNYGIEYRRQVFSRVHILAGVNTVNGFNAFVGAGVNF